MIATTIDQLNALYVEARQCFAPGGERIHVVGEINEIHDEICDGTRHDCMRCREFDYLKQEAGA